MKTVQRPRSCHSVSTWDALPIRPNPTGRVEWLVAHGPRRRCLPAPTATRRFGQKILSHDLRALTNRDGDCANGPARPWAVGWHPGPGGFRAVTGPKGSNKGSGPRPRGWRRKEHCPGPVPQDSHPLCSEPGGQGTGSRDGAQGPRRSPSSAEGRRRPLLRRTQQGGRLGDRTHLCRSVPTGPVKGSSLERRQCHGAGTPAAKRMGSGRTQSTGADPGLGHKCRSPSSRKGPSGPATRGPAPRGPDPGSRAHRPRPPPQTGSRASRATEACLSAGNRAGGLCSHRRHESPGARERPRGARDVRVGSTREDGSRLTHSLRVRRFAERPPGRSPWGPTPAPFPAHAHAL